MRTPWLKIFAAGYLSSPFVQALEPEQELWYLRLILASAISDPPGCLPAETSKLWRLAKAPSPERFQEHCKSILAKFERDEDAGLYRLPAIADELAACAELSTKRAAAGKKGARTRWEVSR